MKRLYLILLALCLTAVSAAASWAGRGETDVVLDSNTAFYEGQALRYSIPSPRNFRLVIEEAYADGYSMAFIPRAESYDTASVMIGVNIYKNGGLSFDSIIAQDTVALRKHFGQQTAIREVPPLVASGGQSTRTFYLKNPKSFVPNVAIAYFDGGSEVLIFELVITERILAYKAEQLFADFVRNFKPMKRGTLGNR